MSLSAIIMGIAGVIILFGGAIYGLSKMSKENPIDSENETD